MKPLKEIAKSTGRIAALCVALPFAVAALFGRFRPGFEFCAQLLAFAPGLAGSYLRVAYYRMTLKSCSPDIFVGLGSFFAHPETEVESGVGIGAYCVLGRVKLGKNSLLASGVQILSGGQQHLRDPDGHLISEGGVFTKVTVGRDCWIGAAATVMSNLGEQVTVAAGSVVAKDVAARAVVAGNPARVVRAVESVGSLA
jgi:virginiamycin A acetyltransferase